MPKSQKARDLFISHAWRYHDDWNLLSRMLDAYDTRAWRNFSLPWFDPALNPATESGGATLRWNLESQIIPVDVVVLLDSVFAQQSSRKWIDFEIEMAIKHSKPMVALPPGGETMVSPELTAIVNATGNWDPEQLLASVDKLLASSGRASAQEVSR
jgi:MTH538 TIR-like domain (DUF1863)